MVKVKSLHDGFYSMKQLGVFSTPPEWDASPLQIITSAFVRFP